MQPRRPPAVQRSAMISAPSAPYLSAAGSCGMLSRRAQHPVWIHLACSKQTRCHFLTMLPRDSSARRIVLPHLRKSKAAQHDVGPAAGAACHGAGVGGRNAVGERRTKQDMEEDRRAAAARDIQAWQIWKRDRCGCWEHRQTDVAVAAIMPQAPLRPSPAVASSKMLSKYALHEL
jgi:hypothetical protein